MLTWQVRRGHVPLRRPFNRMVGDVDEEEQARPRAATRPHTHAVSAARCSVQSVTLQHISRR
jgi:hypothetical protein